MGQPNQVLSWSYALGESRAYMNEFLAIVCAFNIPFSHAADESQDFKLI